MHVQINVSSQARLGPTQHDPRPNGSVACHVGLAHGLSEAIHIRHVCSYIGHVGPVVSCRAQAHKQKKHYRIQNSKARIKFISDSIACIQNFRYRLKHGISNTHILHFRGDGCLVIYLGGSLPCRPLNRARHVPASRARLATQA